MKKSAPSDLQNSSRDSGVLVAAIVVVLAALVFLGVSGCPKPIHTRVPSYEEARSTALKEAPFIRKPIEERQQFRCKDKAVTLRKDIAKGIPFTGNLLTNDKVECLIAIKAERDRVRKELSATKLQMRIREIIKDAAIQRLVEQARPTWWQLHSWKVLAPTLIAVGGALVLGVVYALTGGKPININTNAIIKP
ncbi:hypothetical protein LCGC14_0645840 [marine sediment metagenome]|uniref:Uncharacterized protein n=1 Tax=marine sediment metagenome TaxID=412755 RepID=A0A0F9TJF7_9ZZZZ